MAVLACLSSMSSVHPCLTPGTAGEHEDQFQFLCIDASLFLHLIIIYGSCCKTPLLMETSSEKTQVKYIKERTPSTQA